MARSESTIGAYLIAAGLGAIAGALGVIAITRALPSMMAGMMSKMMAEMGGEGCDPEEM